MNRRSTVIGPLQYPLFCKVSPWSDVALCGIDLLLLFGLTASAPHLRIPEHRSRCSGPSVQVRADPRFRWSWPLGHRPGLVTLTADSISPPCSCLPLFSFSQTLSLPKQPLSPISRAEPPSYLSPGPSHKLPILSGPVCPWGSAVRGLA